MTPILKNYNENNLKRILFLIVLVGLIIFLGGIAITTGPLDITVKDAYQVMFNKIAPGICPSPSRTYYPYGLDVTFSTISDCGFSWFYTCSCRSNYAAGIAKPTCKSLYPRHFVRGRFWSVPGSYFGCRNFQRPLFHSVELLYFCLHLSTYYYFNFKKKKHQS